LFKDSFFSNKGFAADEDEDSELEGDSEDADMDTR